MKKTTIALLSLFVTVLIVSTTFNSCTRDSAPPKLDCPLPDTVSFSQDIQALFDANCSTSGCHTGINPAGGLDLSVGQSYSQLTATGSGYIDTLNPKLSLLYSQMTSQSSPMPPTGKLDGCKIALVLKWIEQKAKNN